MHCNFCKTEKAADMFYASNKSKCKECIKETVKKHRQENLEIIRAYDRFRGSMPHRVAARQEYSKTPAYAKSHQASNLRWMANHPDRRKASHTVNNAVRDGRLQRQPCWCCGDKAQAHHPDYSRPLDVVWLCPKHHKQAHAIT
jgi:hypothetical protein